MIVFSIASRTRIGFLFSLVGVGKRGVFVFLFLKFRFWRLGGWRIVVSSYLGFFRFACFYRYVNF